MALLKLLQKSLDLQDILLIFLSVGKLAGSVMLPAVLEEHALSLLEIQTNVKGRVEEISLCATPGLRKQRCASCVQADSIGAKAFLEVNLI